MAVPNNSPNKSRKAKAEEARFSRRLTSSSINTFKTKHTSSDGLSHSADIRLVEIGFARFLGMYVTY